MTDGLKPNARGPATPPVPREAPAATAPPPLPARAPVSLPDDDLDLLLRMNLNPRQQATIRPAPLPPGAPGAGAAKITRWRPDFRPAPAAGAGAEVAAPPPLRSGPVTTRPPSGLAPGTQQIAGAKRPADEPAEIAGAKRPAIAPAEGTPPAQRRATMGLPARGTGAPLEPARVGGAAVAHHRGVGDGPQADAPGPTAALVAAIEAALGHLRRDEPANLALADSTPEGELARAELLTRLDHLVPAGEARRLADAGLAKVLGDAVYRQRKFDGRFAAELAAYEAKRAHADEATDDLPPERYINDLARRSFADLVLCGVKAVLKRRRQGVARKAETRAEKRAEKRAERRAEARAATAEPLSVWPPTSAPITPQVGDTQGAGHNWQQRYLETVAMLHASRGERAALQAELARTTERLADALKVNAEQAAALWRLRPERDWLAQGGPERRGDVAVHLPHEGGSEASLEPVHLTGGRHVPPAGFPEWPTSPPVGAYPEPMTPRWGTSPSAAPDVSWLPSPPVARRAVPTYYPPEATLAPPPQPPWPAAPAAFDARWSG